MAAIPHPPEAGRAEEPVRGRRTWSEQLLVPEMWAGLAIAVIWLAVLFTAVFGPDLVSNGPSGMTTIPCAVLVAPFAWLATWIVAKYGFGRGRERGD